MRLTDVFEPYEGGEPYIFISYAHKDAEVAGPLLERLYNRGYRIWYDEGIRSGHEWGDDVAKHLKKSKLVIALLSESFGMSDYCKKEIYFAIEKKIPILPVFIEKFVDLPDGLAMQLNITQAINRSLFASEDLYVDSIVNAIEDYDLLLQDFSRSKKPLVMNGKTPPSVFLKRDGAIADLHTFFDNSSNKLLFLKDVSGAGKSTLLLKYIQDDYSWERHGNLIYYSFEYSPYFSSFILELGKKSFNTTIEESSIEDIINRLLAFWGEGKTTIVLDAVEHLFMQTGALDLGVISDARFLVFLNRALELRDIKIIISSKVGLPVLEKLPQSEILHLQDIKEGDFFRFLTDLSISYTDDDLPYLREVLSTSAGNMATILMFTNYVKEFNGASIEKTRVNDDILLFGDLKIDEKLFDFYWSQFTDCEKEFLKLFGALRKEISKSALIRLIPRGANRLTLLPKVKNYLLIESITDGDGEDMLSLHNVFKTAIMAHTTDEERKKIHRTLSDVYIDTNTDDLYTYLAKKTERIYHLIVSGETEGSIDLLLSVSDGLEQSFINMIYYNGQFPACIELNSLLLDKISRDNEYFATLNRKLAMALDKNGATVKSLVHFDAYIDASREREEYDDYIKGIYYKSEPISRLGDYEKAKELVLFAESEAKRLGRFDSRVNSNLKGRYAIYCTEEGALSEAEKSVMSALDISLSGEYTFSDREVIRCWWHLVRGRIKAKHGLFDEARAEFEKSLSLSKEFGYNDFEAECYAEMCIMAILQGENPQSLFEEATRRATDNIYLVIRLQLVRAYIMLRENPRDTLLQNLILSTRLLLGETEYEHLNAVCDIIECARNMHLNTYDISLPKKRFNTEVYVKIGACESYMASLCSSLQSAKITLNILTDYIKELL